MNAVKNITPEEAAQWMENSEAVLIDVRNPAEYMQERIPFATLLPVPQVKAQIANLVNAPGSKQKKFIFHCKSGGRSGGVCADLAELEGAEEVVYNLQGGIVGWKAAGYPVLSGEIPEAITLGGAANSSARPAPVSPQEFAAGKSPDPSDREREIFQQVSMIAGLSVLIFIVVGLLGYRIGFVLAALAATGLIFAGVTGICGMAMLLRKAPWNRRTDV